MDGLVLLTSVVAGAAVLLTFYGVWSLTSAERVRVAWRVNRTGIGISRRPAPAADVGVQERSSGVFMPMDRALSKYTWAERARRDLQRAEINLHLSEFIALRVVATAAAFGIPFLIALSSGESIYAVIGLGLAAFVWFLAGQLVRRRISRRVAAIEAYLDEALDSIAGSLRAGFSFPQACQMTVNQLHWPLKDELQEMLEEINVGGSLDDALRHLAERIESYEVDITVNAVLVQRQVGGSLAEILESVAKTIRERRELRGHVMSLTAQQRFSAYIIAGVPVFLAVILSLTNWEFMKPLFLTTTGNVLLVVGAVFNVLGFLVLKRLSRVDY